MKIQLASALQTDSIVDGAGLRTVIWTQGCRHNCKDCHNPDTHSFEGGLSNTTEHIISLLPKLKLQKGITFSGGDPFEQAEACAEIAFAAKNLGLDIWAYTGYTFEYLINAHNKDWDKFLSVIDFLVDGPFIVEKKSLLLRFKGSSNQRIIDVQASLKEKKIIISEYN